MVLAMTQEGAAEDRRAGLNTYAASLGITPPTEPMNDEQLDERAQQTLKELRSVVLQCSVKDLAGDFSLLTLHTVGDTRPLQAISQVMMEDYNFEALLEQAPPSALERALAQRLRE